MYSHQRKYLLQWIDAHGTNTITSIASLSTFVLAEKPVPGIQRKKGIWNTEPGFKFSPLSNCHDCLAAEPSESVSAWVQKG